MEDFSSGSSSPWYEMRSKIDSVIIENGVTSIGNYAFSNFKLKYEKYLDYFNDSLIERFSSLNKDAPQIIKDAMRYAVEGGGKRVRPVLCYAVCEMLGGNISAVKELALAIEFIHGYSLVHDDLPAMDNDDYRRGKLSTHKKFGEAYGILAGDALLNFAFETILSKDGADADYYRAAREIAEYAGYCGMIGGQVLDLMNEKSITATEQNLYDIYVNKTAKLISAPILAASLVCGGKYYDKLKEYGYNLGVLFQITDDFMDAFGTFGGIGKTPLKDEKEDKLTSIKVFGVDGAKRKAEEHYEIAKAIITDIDGVGFMSDFTDFVFRRKS